MTIPEEADEPGTFEAETVEYGVDDEIIAVLSFVATCEELV